MIYHGLLSERDVAGGKPLLDVLDLLAHLFDKHFQLNGGVRHFSIDRFRRQGVRLAVELLHHKVEAGTDRFFLLQNIPRLFHVCFQTIQLFGDVYTLRHQHQLLLEAVVFQLYFRIFQLGNQTLALPL